MKLDTIYYDQIKAGKKIYETRVYDQKRRKMKLLDKIIFKDSQDGSRSFEAQIVELSFFSDFRQAIEQVGIKKVLPSARSLDQGVKIYNSFNSGKYERDAKKYGVVRMKFLLL